MNRRELLGLFLSSTAAAVLGRRADAGPLDQGIGGTGVLPSDQGIGGTGVAPPRDESDRGIGGTGVIGTIRKFGSIVVNDLRIAYPKDAVVRIDGRPAAASDLKIGQVVRVAASGKDDALSTKTIDVTSEVVGPVEKTGKTSLTVLGQKVSTKDIETGDIKKGDVVAVSGLRRNDGIISASLVEPRPGAPSRVAGPLVSKDGKLKIGGLRVTGVDPDLAGRRVLVEGARDGSRFVASHATTETSLLPRSVRNLSIESYVERHGDSLRLGSGYGVGSGGDLDFPAGRSVRAVLQTRIEPDGRLAVESVRAGGRTYGGPGHGGPGGGGPRGGGPRGDGPRGGGSRGGGRGDHGGRGGHEGGPGHEGGRGRGGPGRDRPGRDGGPGRGGPGRDGGPGREDGPRGHGPGEHRGRRGGEGRPGRGRGRRAEGSDFGGGFDGGGPRGGSFDPGPRGNPGGGGGGFEGGGGGFGRGPGGGYAGGGGFGGPGGGGFGGGGFGGGPGGGGGFGGPGGGGFGGGGGPGGGGPGGGGGGGRR